MKMTIYVLRNDFLLIVASSTEAMEQIRRGVSETLTGEKIGIQFLVLPPETIIEDWRK